MPDIYRNQMKFNIFGKKFKCDKCGSKFKNEADLIEHRTREHRT